GPSGGPSPWPGGAQAAIGTASGSVIAATPSAHSAPIASVAKVMTALVVLDTKPLQKGETGPAITITPDDVTEFQQRQANQESVVAAPACEQAPADPAAPDLRSHSRPNTLTC